MIALGRIMVALVTPFTETGEIDYKSTVNLIERCIQDQVDGLVLCGTTGECSTLIDQEKEEFLRFVIRIVNRRMQVWMGCGTNNTATTLACCEMAAQYPIDGIMLITPYYNRPSQQGMRMHFKTIAERIPLPIMLYNVPKRTGVNLQAQTVIELCQECPNIVALKQAANDFDETQKIISGCDWQVLCGDDGLLLEGLRSGMEGIVSVVGHLYAGLIRQIFDQFDLGIEDRQNDEKLKKLTRICFSVSSPSDIKALLSMQGLCRETVRLPLVPLNSEQKAAMRRMLDKL